jgi:hypothetical protein
MTQNQLSVNYLEEKTNNGSVNIVNEPKKSNNDEIWMVENDI